MTGLCVFKHDPVTVICLAADHSYTVIVLYIQFQIFFNNLTGGKATVFQEKVWKTCHRLLGNYKEDYQEEKGTIVLRPYETMVLEN